MTLRRSRKVAALAAVALLIAACQSVNTTPQAQTTPSQPFIPPGCTSQKSGPYVGAAVCTNQDLTGIANQIPLTPNLNGAILTNTSLAGLPLTGVQLMNATLNGATFADAKMDGANLSGATARQAGASFTETALPNANLSNAILPHGAFNADVANNRPANLSGANFTGATITNGTFAGSTLTNTNLTNANLSSTDFTGANFNNTNMDSANLFSTAGLTLGGPPPGMNCNFTTWVDGTVRSGNGCTVDQPLTMTIVNNSGKKPSQVFIGVMADTATPLVPDCPLSNTKYFTPVPGQGNAYSFQVTAPAQAGTIWISLDSPIGLGANPPPDCPLGDVPTTRPDPNTSQVRYALAEFSYPGTADVTNVDTFSIPLDIATTNNGAVVASSGFSSNTDCVLNDFKTAFANPYAPKSTQSAMMYNGPQDPNDITKNFLRVISPAKTAPPTFPKQPWPDMSTYVNTIQNKQITVTGNFTNPSYPPEFGYYNYKGTMDSSGNLKLTGNIGATVSGTGAKQGLSVETTAAELAAAFYSQAGSYTVQSDPPQNRGTVPPEVTAPNDIYNSIYRDLITGFTSGYWGGKFPDRADPYKNASFLNQQPFAAARTKGEAFLAYSLYSAVLRDWTPSYSMPYGENYGSGSYPSPLLSLNTPEFRLTILPDKTPTTPDSPFPKNCTQYVPDN